LFITKSNPFPSFFIKTWIHTKALCFKHALFYTNRTRIHARDEEEEEEEEEDNEHYWIVPRKNPSLKTSRSEVSQNSLSIKIISTFKKS